MTARHTAYISIGSNIGDKLENCRWGIRRLDCDTVWLKAESRIYQTEPVDYTDQDWFINLVVKIETLLDPNRLLQRLQSIQREAGRLKDSIRFGPRVLDLDIIFYDEVVINSKQLVVPHPRMHKRRFVLQPLCDIDPAITHPVLKTNVRTLLNRLDDNEQKIIEYR
jgi:2-amino-4-hydroxy-6-hydroxymethyldihydropteridine diphosphokinase